MSSTAAPEEVGVFSLLARGSVASVQTFHHHAHRPHVDPHEEEFDTLALILTEAGEWAFRSARGSGRVNSARIVVADPGAAYACTHDERFPTDRTLELAFHGGLAHPEGENLVPRSLVDHTPRTWELARRVADEVAAERPLRDLAVDALAVELLVEVARAGGDRTPPPSVRRHQDGLAAAHDYVHAQLAEDLSLAVLARVAHMSPWYLVRLFRDAFGATPRQYVIRARMECAAGLLRDGALPIAAIAAEVGFRSPRHFAAIFRRTFGVSPSRFRAG